MCGQGQGPWEPRGHMGRSQGKSGLFPGAQPGALHAGHRRWAPLTPHLPDEELGPSEALEQDSTPLPSALSPPSTLPHLPDPGQTAGSLEPLWGQEVQQMEQLLQVVLQGGPRQQQLVINLVAVQDPKELRGGEGGIRGGSGRPGQGGGGRGKRRPPWTGCS